MAASTKKPVKDLFDDTSMTFGEHLDVLRVHLFKAIIGLVIATCVTLLFGESLIRFINAPITAALHKQGLQGAAIKDDVSGFDIWAYLGFSSSAPAPEPVPDARRDELTVEVLPSQLEAALQHENPSEAAKPSAAPPKGEKPVTLVLRSPVFAEWREAAERTLRPVTLNVQEGFMTYLKVSLVAGTVVASPWIFYQIWLFVAAGLYPHERKYVHFYLPLALVLFLGGAVFCFYVVLPFVLNFLLGFNVKLGIVPQIRLSEWISFALLLPVMFGLSFELPVVMLLLERLQIVDVTTYREKRRIAILVIAFLSMVLTPADPMSMIAMMAPLILLYEFGIWMCRLRPVNASPFGEAA
jgi:sec-independent protein translocase protein TatC